VGHHVVANFLFPGGGNLIVDVFRMGFQLGNLLIGDGQTQLLLRLRRLLVHLHHNQDFPNSAYDP